MFKKFISFVLSLLITMSFNTVFAAEDTSVLYGGKIPYVSGVQLKNEDMTDAHFNKLRETGLGFVRKGIYWSGIEKTKGVYDWEQTDKWVNMIEDEGMSMIMTVVWNNRLYEDIYDRAIVTEDGRKAFAKFTADLVTHYKGKDIVFEIWNEPNLRSFWHENDTNKSNTKEMAKEYTDLVLACVPAMKAADPECKIAICSISCLWEDSFSWFEGCIDSGILNCKADYISVHPYGFAYPELAMQNGYPVIRKYLDDNGRKDMGIINSEVGYAKGSLMDLGATESNVLEMQAWHFVRQNFVDMMSGVALSNWYEFSDTASWGVVNNNLTERPAHKAAAVMTSQLNGYKYLYRIYNGNADDYIIVFGNDEGRKKIAVWSSPNTSMPSDQRIPVAHEITVPVGRTGTHTVTDIFGNTSTLSSENDTLTITIDGAPRYIDNVSVDDTRFSQSKFPLADDTYADGGNKTLIRGSSNYIYTKSGESRNIYIKGDISEADKDKEIESVKLYLYMFIDTTNDATIKVTARDGGSLPVYGVLSNNWSETTLKWNDGIPDLNTTDTNVPLGNLIVESEENNGFDRYYSFDVTNFALASEDGIFTLKITGDPSNTSAYKFKSKECGNDSMIPYIEVTYKETGLSMTKGNNSVVITAPDSFTGKLIFAEYRSDGTVNDIELIDITESGEIEVPEAMTGTVKAILVENLDNIKPVLNSVNVK